MLNKFKWKSIIMITVLSMTFIFSNFTAANAAPLNTIAYGTSEITDALNDWSKAYSHSSNVVFDTANSANFGGDTSRITRNTTAAGSVIYNMKNLSFFKFKLYGTSTVDGKVKCYTSPDNITWTEISLMHDTPVLTAGSWYSANFTAGIAIPGRTNYLKIEISNSAAASDPQVGEVRLSNVPSIIIDECGDWSRAYSHTGNLGFDGSNPVNFHGDRTRITRTSQDSASSVTYKLSDIYTFAVKFYYRIDYTNKIKVYASSNNSTWTNIGLSYDSPAYTVDDWYRTYVRPSASLPSGTTYLKIEIANDAAVWSPQIARVEISGNLPLVSGQIIDEMNDYSKMFAHSPNFWFDNMNINQFSSDLKRLARSTQTSEYIVYNSPADMKSFITDTYFASPIVDFIFYTSADNVNYTAFTPDKINRGGTYTRVRYSASSLPSGTRYLKIQYPITQGEAWTPQISRVSIDYGGGQVPIPDNADYTRLQNVFKKVKSGQNITVGVIGGSITVGANADMPQTWANRVKAWWDTNFPGKVTFVNAGIGSTNSELGAYRAGKQLLASNPDLVILEYAVNDSSNPYAENTYEGLVRQILKRSNNPAVMCLFLCGQDGNGNEQIHHIPVAEYYGLPMAYYANNITNLMFSNSDSWYTFYSAPTSSFNVAPYGDGIHPGNGGHEKAALYITEKLEYVLNSLPATVPAANPMPSQPLYTDTFEYAKYMTSNDISPTSETTGTWSSFNGSSFGPGWQSNTVGNQLVFDVMGTSVGFMYLQNNNPAFGMVEAWVDNGPHKIIDTYASFMFDVYTTVQSGLSPGMHKLYIKILSQTNPASTGHTAIITNVLAAGNPGTPVVYEDFSSVGDWGDNTFNSTVTSDGNLGTFTCGSNPAGYGTSSKGVSYNVDTYPNLRINISEVGSGAKWALKVSDGSSDIPLQLDTSTAGVLTYNLKAITGWSGNKKFQIKLFPIGGNGKYFKVDYINIQ